MTKSENWQETVKMPFYETLVPIERKDGSKETAPQTHKGPDLPTAKPTRQLLRLRTTRNRSQADRLSIQRFLKGRENETQFLSKFGDFSTHLPCKFL